VRPDGLALLIRTRLQGQVEAGMIIQDRQRVASPREQGEVAFEICLVLSVI
jgi:hypothetical protein